MGPLERAIDVHRRLSGAELLAADIATALDRLPHGVLLLSANGRVQFVSRTAEDILAARDGLTLEHGSLRAATVSATNRLRAALRDAHRTAAGELSPGDTMLVLERPSGKRPLSLVAAPLPRRRVTLGSESAAVTVLVTDPDRTLPTPGAMLRTLFRLTRAEADLVSLLVEGATLQEAAARLALAPDTVRKRLKTVFQKTGTHRQAELVRLILLSTLPRSV
jgi:DNA-binding CsgD family transcriptional regulator